MKVTALIMLLILSTATTCCADKNEFSIGYAPICRHLNEDDPNESNNGIFVSYDKWMGGTFINSYSKRSYFLGRSFKTSKWTPFNNEVFGRANFHIGAMYGYGKEYPNVGGWTLGGAPTIEIGYNRLSIETMIIPVDGGVISFMFKYTW